MKKLLPVFLLLATTVFADDVIRRGAAVPKDAAGYERIVYMFSGHDPDAVAEARVAWKALSGGDDAVTYWQQDASGRWVKKG